MRIKRIIRAGQDAFAADAVDTDDLMMMAGRLLDKACAHEITGTVVFEGEDGVMYCGSVEFSIDKISDEYLKLLQEEDRESAGTN